MPTTFNRLTSFLYFSFVPPMGNNEDQDKQGSEEQASEASSEDQESSEESTNTEEPTEETAPIESRKENSGSSGDMDSYWRANKRLILMLLAIWATMGIGMSILFVEPLNKFNVPGGQIPFGFWMAQQGSIYGFVILIFFYAWRMDKIDKDHDVHE
jgi:putative solute:sodium symporter small subunit